jgi:hypothetical protein
MVDAHEVRRIVEQALALAHAAIDDPSPTRIAEARRHAAHVLPTMARATARGVPLGDAKQLVDLVSQLRAVLQVAERRSTLAHGARN